MFSPEDIPKLRTAVRECALGDRKLLDDLRKEVQSLKPNVRTIRPRSTTSISLVASDGGNNKLNYDPFYFQLVRVVDSNGKEECLDTVSPTTDTDLISKRQFNDDGSPKTNLGFLMRDLKCSTLNELSHMIPKGSKVRNEPDKVSPSWVLTYRDLCEWAVLYHRICYTSFSTNTLIVRDGLLRSKLFRGELFIQLRKKIEDAINRILKEKRIKVFLVGLAKHSKVLARYSLAMSIENILPGGEPRYARVPRELESKAYVWSEWSRGVETEDDDGEAPKFVAGDMYFVRFGRMTGDPIWIVDILSKQKHSDAEIFSYLLADAIHGFPVPYYPLCLQKAHDYAQVVDFDFDILQNEIINSIRDILPEDRKGVIDQQVFNSDKSKQRYE